MWWSLCYLACASMFKRLKYWCGFFLFATWLWLDRKIEDGSRLENQKRAYSCRLEAFSVQLVILAIWKQALHICHAQAASAMEGSPCREVGQRESYNKNASDSHDIGSVYHPWPDSVCQQIEKEFLLEVDRAENLAQDLGQVDGMINNILILSSHSWGIIMSSDANSIFFFTLQKPLKCQMLLR